MASAHCAGPGSASPPSPHPTPFGGWGGGGVVYVFFRPKLCTKHFLWWLLCLDTWSDIVAIIIHIRRPLATSLTWRYKKKYILLSRMSVRTTSFTIQGPLSYLKAQFTKRLSFFMDLLLYRTCNCILHIPYCHMLFRSPELTGFLKKSLIELPFSLCTSLLFGLYLIHPLPCVLS